MAQLKDTIIQGNLYLKGEGVKIYVNDTEFQGGGGSGDANVQSDWNESTETSDAFIKNKPPIENGAGEKSIAIGNGDAIGKSSTAEGKAMSIGEYSHAEGTGFKISDIVAAPASITEVTDTTLVTSLVLTQYLDKLPTDTNGFIISVDNGKYYPIKSFEKKSLSTVQLTIEDGYTFPSDLTSYKITDALSGASYGNSSHSENDRTLAIGDYSHAEGELTKAVGKSTHTEGRFTQAIGVASHAEGELTVASANYSHAEGCNTEASGALSHAEGYYTKASGVASHAEGCNTEAIGYYSHAEGRFTQAIGAFSHAEGYNTKAISSYAHAEGNKTTGSGDGSHAEGLTTIASGHYSHAEGCNTEASGNWQHVQGRWNIEDATYAHIVGNGNDSNTRSNAHTLDWQGNAWYQGSVTSNGADYAEFFEWQDGNPDNEDRVGLLVTLDGEKIRLANSGDEILGIISGTAAVLGDNYECEWNGKYLTDDFGRVIYDMVEEFAEIPHVEIDDEGNRIETIETVSLGFFKHPRINPDYDPSKEYVNRADRPEWDTVGMLGKLFVKDDGTCIPNYYATVGENGIATSSLEKTNMRVLSRVNDNVVRVLLK